MGLEDKVNDSGAKKFIKKTANLAWKVGVATATTALNYSLVGATGLMISGAVGIGKAIGSTWKGDGLYTILNKSLTSYSVLNTILHPMILLGDYTFPIAYGAGIDMFGSQVGGYITNAAYAATAYAGAFVAAAGTAHHLIDNYLNPSGLGKSVTHNFVNRTVRIGTTYLPGLALVASNVNPIGGIPWFALNALFAEPYNEKYPVKERRASGKVEYHPHGLAQAAHS